MRRILSFAVLMLIVAALVIPAGAATTASTTGVYATVASDGVCQVTMTATIHLDQPADDLTFPVPLNAGNVTLNGSHVRTKSNGEARLISLSRIVGNAAGDFSININYSLRGLLKKTEDGILTLEIPILSGFSYPTDLLEFSVTLPGEIREKPAFSSGYHQASIEQDITYSLSGATVTGNATTALKDHETLKMILTVDPEMFPGTQAVGDVFTPDATWMLILSAAALLYWILFLRFFFPLRQEAGSMLPEGYGAGQVQGILHLRGADLTMMVLQWAQLGYVTIHTHKRMGVTVVKQMDMGNERSLFEQKAFRSLFQRRDTVDCGSLFYVEQCRKAQANRSSLQALVKKGSGNPGVFRLLFAAVAVIGGATLGLTMGFGGILQIPLAVIMSIFGGISGYIMQSWAEDLLILPSGKRRAGLIHGIIWLLLGLASGQFLLGVGIAASQLLAGLLAAFGGKRSPWGKEQFIKTLRLRKYLRTVSREEVARISGQNPEYFYTLAPYALALGVDKRFAAKFGGIRLPECAYLVTGTREEGMTAALWSARMRHVAEDMNARLRGQNKEKAMKFLGNLMGLVAPAKPKRRK